MSAGILCHVEWYIATDFGWLILPFSLGSSFSTQSPNAGPTKRNACGWPRNLFSSGVYIWRNTWQLQNVSGITLFLRSTKQCQHLSYIFLKIVPFCNHTLLPATVKVLHTFLEAILWKLFQAFRRILKYISNVTKTPSLRCWFQSRE